MDFVAVARTYVGTPFKHQGRLPGVGLDCAGVVVCALREVDYHVEDVYGYGRLPARGLFLRTVERQFDRVAALEIRGGDLLTFAFRGEPQHIAIYTAQDTLIHAYSEVRQVVEHGLDDIWRSRLRGCYRLRDLG